MKLKILSPEERLALNELGERAKLEAQAKATLRQVVELIEHHEDFGKDKFYKVFVLPCGVWQELKDAAQ